MRIIRFLWDNLYNSDDTTRTSSSAASGFPLSNIVHRWHTRCWRSTGDADEWVKADLGSAKAINAFICKGHNFTDAATLTIQAHTSDAWGAPSISVVLPVTSGQIVKFWEIAKTYRWWRWKLVDAANPDTYLKIGIIYLGTWFEPQFNFRRIYSKKLRDPSIKSRSTGGQISVNEKDHYKILGYDFPHIKTPDNTTFETIFATVGQSKPYFIVQDADIPTNTYYIENTIGWDIIHVSIDVWFSLRIEVEEMR